MDKRKNVSRKKGTKVIVGIVVIFILYLIGISNKDDNNAPDGNKAVIISPTSAVEQVDNTEIEAPTSLPEIIDDEQPAENTIVNTDATQPAEENTGIIEYNGISYNVVEVDGGDLSGERIANVAVDIGYGDRVYWALTNEYGQLVHVLADKIILQDDASEDVNSDGRYYNEEASVPGTEREDLDQGHVIADSLGGVSNAYNITPQDSTLNRYGDQAYMEEIIRDAGGCENFVATITYSDAETQIPSHYKYEYILNGEKIVDEFDNVNPDEVNAALTKDPAINDKSTTSNLSSHEAELAKIDTNGNGKVTIAEAKAAGVSMPVYSDNWIYEFMDDRDGDGVVGE